MAVKSQPSLTDILNTFIHTQEKIANDGEPAAMGPPAMGPEEIDPQQLAMLQQMQGMPQGYNDDEDEEITPEAIAAAAQNLAQTRQQADASIADASQQLQEVANEFINEHTAALRKEAAIFGRIFASSCLDEMDKVASEAHMGNVFDKIAADSYYVTMAKLAGVDSEDIEDLSPGELADLVEQVQAEDDEPYYYDDEDDDDYYGDDDDQSPEEVAAAVNLLQDAREDGEAAAIEDALEEVKEAAYNETLNSLYYA